ncbi:15462_t:CDS:2 [Acaulospora colombiana]|uniref:15462_t:CDS:1 n=1 Tax=Acaulospora colombiana TaxID=27376 RepID=A0ACA9MS59_9GLOM|nr:15462_t:CDS:2 [Acaulospora colombiana]
MPEDDLPGELDRLIEVLSRRFDGFTFFSVIQIRLFRRHLYFCGNLCALLGAFFMILTDDEKFRWSKWAFEISNIFHLVSGGFPAVAVMTEEERLTEYKARRDAAQSLLNHIVEGIINEGLMEMNLVASPQDLITDTVDHAPSVSSPQDPITDTVDHAPSVSSPQGPITDTVDHAPYVSSPQDPITDTVDHASCVSSPECMDIEQDQEDDPVSTDSFPD